MNLLKSVRMLKRRALYRYEGPRKIRSDYRRFFGKELAEQPTTLTEKIAHRMIDLHRRDNPAFTRLADKIEVNDFVKERVGERYLLDIIWQGTDPGAIPFDSLPDKCMAKTNHEFGFNHALIRPFDRELAIRQLREWLRRNYYFVGREAQYLKIKRRILIQPFIEEEDGARPLDYRLWCFDGKPEFIQADDQAHSINPFFDTDWNRLPFSYRDYDFAGVIARPSRLDEMLEVAAALSQGFDFVRVDLFNVRDRVIFGEMTFTPVVGKMRFMPEHWDRELGEKWRFQPA